MAVVIDGSLGIDKVKDGAITESKMADGAITEAKMADGAITDSKMADSARKLTDIETNIALLAFHRAADNSKAVFNMVDSVVDTFTDATGIDTSTSTNHSLSSGHYKGQSSVSGDATGGTITYSGGYTYHAFTGDGSFVAPSSANITVLVVGGGGSGRSCHTGQCPGDGGGGGSQSYDSNRAVTAQTYTMDVGNGGAGGTAWNDGQSSTAFGMTGSGGSRAIHGGVGPNGTSHSAFSSFGASGVFGGGGGGNHQCGGNGGAGHAGNSGCSGGQWGTPGAANTGGGGGGGASSYDSAGGGGTGVILVRYTTNLFTTYSTANLTLQSTATAADATPTTGDIVMMIEDSTGTATLNTDIKGYVSRDGGTTWTQGTLTDEGSWGSSKKVLAFHNLDISAQPAGTSMKYKVTTHNQSASKETRVHATSLSWA